MHKKISIIIISTIVLLLFSCEMQRFDSVASLRSLSKLESVVFKASKNIDLVMDCTGTISGDQILVQVPPHLNLPGPGLGGTALIPDIKIANYASMSIDGMVIVNGVSSYEFKNGFDHQLIIKMPDGTSKRWKLRLVETFTVEIYSSWPVGGTPSSEEVYQNSSTANLILVTNAPITDKSSVISAIYAKNSENILGCGFPLIDDDISSDYYLPPGYIWNFNVEMNAGTNTLVIPFGGLDGIQYDDDTYNSDTLHNSIKMTLDDTQPAPLINPEIFERGDNSVIFSVSGTTDLQTPINELQYEFQYVYGADENDIPTTILDGTNGSASPSFTMTNVMENHGVISLIPDRHYKFILKVTDKAGNFRISGEIPYYAQSAVYVDNTEATPSGDPIYSYVIPYGVYGTKASPFEHIQNALDYAAVKGIPEVKVAQGTYESWDQTALLSSTESDSDLFNSFYIQLYGGIKLKGGYSSGFNSRDMKNKTVITPAVGVTDLQDHIISCSSEYYTNSVWFGRYGAGGLPGTPPDSDTLLEGFILKGGENNDGSGGGAIYTNYGFSVRDCTFVDNYSTSNGAGLFADAPVVSAESLKISISDCVFQNNDTVNTNGGAVASMSFWDLVELEHCTFDENDAKTGGRGGAVYSQSSLNVTDCVFTANTADLNGGAIAFQNGTSKTLSVLDSEFYQNNAKVNGGAIYQNSGFLKMESSYFGVSSDPSQRNWAVDADGGALYFKGVKALIGNETVVDSNCYFYHNQALAGKGGAIYLESTSTLTDPDFLYRTWLNQNEASSGGAIYAKQGFLKTQANHITNNTVTSAGGAGGAIYKEGGGISITINAITGNEAASGGGLYLYDLAEVSGILDSSLRDNRASTSLGGAIYRAGACDLLRITDTIFDNNSSGYDGGAIYDTPKSPIDPVNDPYPSLMISGGSFIGNHALNEGGAIYQLYSDLTVNGVEFSSNESQSSGALYSSKCESKLEIYDSTFDSNKATNGSGGVGKIFTTDKVLLYNNIFRENTSTTEADDGTSSGVWELNNLLSVNVVQNLFIENTATDAGTNNDVNGSLKFSNSAGGIYNNLFYLNDSSVSRDLYLAHNGALGIMNNIWVQPDANLPLFTIYSYSPIKLYSNLIISFADINTAMNESGVTADLTEKDNIYSNDKDIFTNTVDFYPAAGSHGEGTGEDIQSTLAGLGISSDFNGLSYETGVMDIGPYKR